MHDRRTFIARCSAAVAAFFASMFGRGSSAAPRRGSGECHEGGPKPGTSRSKFVSVKDDRPPIRTPVLLIVANENDWQALSIGKFTGINPDTGLFTWDVPREPELPGKYCRVTHWAYQPVPPTDQWNHEYPRLTDDEKYRHTLNQQNFETVSERDFTDLLARHPDPNACVIPEGHVYPRIEV